MSERQPYSGVRMMAVEDPVELAGLDALRNRLASISGALDRWDRVARIEPAVGSEISLDDSMTGWRQLSHGVSHQLNHAADTLRALTVLIPPTGPLAVPLVAHYPVARSALEAASLALWTLAPEDPRERISRHLRNAWREVCAEAEMIAAITKAIELDPTIGLTSSLDRERKRFKAWKRKHVAQIRSNALLVGVADPTTSDWRVGFAEIVRDATAASGLRPIYGEVVWRELSGLSHPSMMRSMKSMDHEEIADHGDGTLAALFTTKTATAKYAVEAAHIAFRDAVETYAARKIRRGDAAAYLPAADSRGAR